MNLIRFNSYTSVLVNDLHAIYSFHLSPANSSEPVAPRIYLFL
jgi:hypothetical protein